MFHWIIGLTLIAVSGCGRFESPVLRCVPTFINGLAPRESCHFVRDGMAIFEGDMVLGNIGVRLKTSRTALSFSPVYLSTYLWSGGIIPYAIDPALPAVERVTGALEEFRNHTGIRFVPRNGERDFIVFRPYKGLCLSSVGRIGGQQDIWLDTSCSGANVLHEIGHALGLWHEQSRSDRDGYVVIHWENVIPGYESAFAQVPSLTQDLNPYDYASIMHYPYWVFSKNGRPTITRLDGSVFGVGGQMTLSAGDVRALSLLYPGARPTDAAERLYLAALYRDLLGRTPKHEEIAFWSSVLAGGATRSAVGEAFLTSKEYRTRELRSAYNRYLRREPDSSGLNWFVTRWMAGASRESLLDVLLGSDEYFICQAHSDPRRYTALLYRDILRRQGSENETNYWNTILLKDGFSPRAATAGAFFRSREYRMLVLDDYYTLYLRRSPSPREREYWLATLESGRPNEWVQVAILGSDEYFQRSGKP